MPGCGIGEMALKQFRMPCIAYSSGSLHFILSCLECGISMLVVQLLPSN